MRAFFPLSGAAFTIPILSAASYRGYQPRREPVQANENQTP
jgi:hypothetical protein